jgi:hypothetical protein
MQILVQTLDGAPAEEWGGFLANIAHVIARDDEHLETDREDGDRFAAIVDGFARAVELREMLTRRYLDGLRQAAEE